jgi:hypothetical protein
VEVRGGEEEEEEEEEEHKTKVLYPAVPVPKHHSMKAYWGIGGIATLIL